MSEGGDEPIEFPRLVDCNVHPMRFEGKPCLFIANHQRLAPNGICLPNDLAPLVPLLDGRHSVAQICRSLGSGMDRATLRRILAALDGAFVLDTPRLRERRQSVKTAFLRDPVRQPVCAGGVYSEDPMALARELDAIYTMDGGAGLPDRAGRSSLPRVVLSPHIDFRRGRHSFGWGMKELADAEPADVYVIVATSHYSLSRFTLTRKSFQTPLGLVETAEDVVDALADGFGPDLFEDECAHQPEHSIELQTVLMAHALTRRPFRIVPLLVGSFSDAVDAGDDPSTLGDVARMVRTLTEVEQGSDLRFCYVVSGDLAHMGPKFGDRWRIDSARSRHCRTRDEALLARMADGDPRSLFAAISEEGDERRVCGFPPLYVALSAARPTGGRLLCYDQFVDPSGSEIVSFASMVFDGPSPKKQPGP